MAHSSTVYATVCGFALARPIRALLLDAQASVEAAPRVAELLAQELGYDLAWQQQQMTTYRTLADGYLLVRQREVGG